MQRVALRGIYGVPKPKNVATVSPVIDSGLDIDEETPLDGVDEQGNNTTRPSSPFRVNEQYEMPQLVLHTKSSARPASSSSSSRFSLARSGSNQDLEAHAARSAASDKYTVLGQKQQWRRNRSQRGGAGGAPATIRHVSADEIDANGEEREKLGERASSYQSMGQRLDAPTFTTGKQSPFASQHSSRESSRADSSRFSSGRRSEAATSENERDREREQFVVTRQKTKYAAKIYLPGQKPLYLGRYSSEEAARAACENAFTTITTPRK